MYYIIEKLVNEKFTVAHKKWISMPKMDIQWISIGYPFHTCSGYPPISMDIHFYPWISMDCPWIDWHGYSWIFILYPLWILVDIYIHFKTTMDIARMVSRSKNIEGYPWISIFAWISISHIYKWISMDNIVRYQKMGWLS